MRAVWGVVVLLALSGCADMVPGSPTAGVPPVESEPREVRPRELGLDKLNACALLTALQKADLGVESGKNKDTPITPWDTVPSCMYHKVDVNHFYHVYFDRYYGVDYWVEVLVDRLNTERLQIAGYPAVKYMQKDGDDDCGVVVGVAEAQQLNVEFSEHQKVGLTREQMCQNAVKAAEMALATLQSLR